MHYAYAKLSKFDLSILRFFGPGLCNLLFPWARSVIATKKHGLTPISPTWFQIKLGPILRREADARFYANLFKKSPDEISGIRKSFILLRHAMVTEDYVTHFISESSSRKNNSKIIVFSGLRDYFNSMIMEHAAIYDELLKITRDEHKKGLIFDFRKSISVHIRLGDFKSRNRPQINWYKNILRQLRAELGGDWPIYIFSDGTDEELAPVMKIPNTKRLTFGSSLADLLALSKAHLLIGTAGSTFSQWASFLGRMPVIWSKGSLTQRLYYDNTLIEIECGEEEKLPGHFVSACKQNQEKRMIFSK
jgi:hypothetical protein